MRDVPGVDELQTQPAAVNPAQDMRPAAPPAAQHLRIEDGAEHRVIPFSCDAATRALARGGFTQALPSLALASRRPGWSHAKSLQPAPQAGPANSVISLGTANSA